MSDAVRGDLATACGFAAKLLAWFDLHGRHQLPWQQDPMPYRVWVSEIMLQQTQVATVIPYYQRFTTRFPTVDALAAADLDEVLHLWTGLGYYARARNLHACAQRVAAGHGGSFPVDIEALMQLPGIGRSTAGAILSIAGGQRHPILDGNVRRVMARMFGIGGDPGRADVQIALWRAADECTPGQRCAAYTQAIMDLGATVCTRSRPACTVCPMNDACFAARTGSQAQLPGAKRRRPRRSREVTLLIAQSEAQGAPVVLLERRPTRGIWGGLWAPPQFDDAPAALAWCAQRVGTWQAAAAPLPPIDHAFTHFDLRLHPLHVRCEPPAQVSEADDRLWYPLDAPPKVGLPQPILQLLERLRGESATARTAATGGVPRADAGPAYTHATVPAGECKRIE